MPDKPASIPAGAFWDDDDNEWVVAKRDAEENFHGMVEYYRPDGTLCCKTEFSHGTPHGTFRRYHENGETSREGEFVEGELEGTNVFTRSSEETSENFPHEGGGKAWIAEMDYEAGSITDARLYDRHRKRIMEDGNAFPEQRPESVPEGATFRKSEADDAYYWVHGKARDNNDGTADRQGSWLYWSPEGALRREIPYVEGKKQGQERSFDEEGVLISEVTYHEDKKLGPYHRRVDEGDMEDPSIVFERGAYGEQESPAGPTEWLDAHEKLIATVDRGDTTDNDTLIEVIEAAADTDFPALGAALQEKRQYAAGILALARALAHGGELEPLREAISATRPPLSEDHAAGLFDYSSEIANQVMRFGGPMAGFFYLADSMRLGTPAHEVLRRGAALLDDYADSGVASDLIDAAMGLAPERKDFEFTRALINMSLGDPEKAKACIATLRQHDEEQADGMAGYLAALYPKYGFWRKGDERANVALEAPPDEEVSLMRKSDDFRWLIQACATRIEVLREALLERLGGKTPDWLVPQLPQLLPEGRIELEETQEIDTGGGIVGLNHRIRAEWDRLCWACWLAGLDELALPGAETTLREFPRFISMFNSWRWIAEGYTNHGGVEPEDDVDRRLLASEWFGTTVSEVWSAVADFMTKDNDELMPTLIWLANSEAPSPFPGVEEDDDEEDDDEEDDDE